MKHWHTKTKNLCTYWICVLLCHPGGALPLGSHMGMCRYTSHVPLTSSVPPPPGVNSDRSLLWLRHDILFCLHTELESGLLSLTGSDYEIARVHYPCGDWSRLYLLDQLKAKFVWRAPVFHLHKLDLFEVIHAWPYMHPRCLVVPYIFHTRSIRKISAVWHSFVHRLKEPEPSPEWRCRLPHFFRLRTEFVRIWNIINRWLIYQGDSRVRWLMWVESMKHI